MNDPKRSEEFVRKVISRLYERPEMYGQTLGEVDLALYLLHLVWAVICDRRDEYEKARGAYNFFELESNEGPVPRGHHINPVSSRSSEGVEEIIAYWSTLDQKIHLDWQEFA
ncbi:MAG: hypothetical protein DWQ31_00740 [Planctomycetota bacterium]|nr:MAG: hypothetical protein DWQ31_00740 [Planctomycetota bacterium]REJ86714.1 MAG: hypothetical protein DWQ35_23080 [Planctomycetota bacterium]